MLQVVGGHCLVILLLVFVYSFARLDILLKIKQQHVKQLVSLVHMLTQPVIDVLLIVQLFTICINLRIGHALLLAHLAILLIKILVNVLEFAILQMECMPMMLVMNVLCNVLFLIEDLILTILAF